MDIQDAVALAQVTMLEHGLIQKGWTLKLTSARGRFGSCSHRTKSINLSRPHIEVNSVAEVNDTILHEVAHALAGPTAAHGPAWKAIAIRLGAKPKASSKNSRLPEHVGNGVTSEGRPRFQVGDAITAKGAPVNGRLLIVTRVNPRTYTAKDPEDPHSRWRIGHHSAIRFTGTYDKPVAVEVPYVSGARRR